MCRRLNLGLGSDFESLERVVGVGDSSGEANGMSVRLLFVKERCDDRFGNMNSERARDVFDFIAHVNDG